MTKVAKKSGWPLWAWGVVLLLCAGLIASVKNSSEPNWERLIYMGLGGRLHGIPDSELRERAYSSMQKVGATKAEFKELIGQSGDQPGEVKDLRRETYRSDSLYLSQFPFYSQQRLYIEGVSRIAYIGVYSNPAMDWFGYLGAMGAIFALALFLSHRVAPLGGLTLLSASVLFLPWNWLLTHASPGSWAVFLCGSGFLLVLGDGWSRRWAILPFALANGFDPDTIILCLAGIILMAWIHPKDRVIATLSGIGLGLTYAFIQALTQPYSLPVRLVQEFKGPYPDGKIAGEIPWSILDHASKILDNSPQLLFQNLGEWVILFGLGVYALKAKIPTVFPLILVLMIGIVVQFMIYPSVEYWVQALLGLSCVATLGVILSKQHSPRKPESQKEQAV